MYPQLIFKTTLTWFILFYTFYTPLTFAQYSTQDNDPIGDLIKEINSKDKGDKLNNLVREILSGPSKGYQEVPAAQQKKLFFTDVTPTWPANPSQPNQPPNPKRDLKMEFPSKPGLYTIVGYQITGQGDSLDYFTQPIHLKIKDENENIFWVYQHSISRRTFLYSYEKTKESPGKRVPIKKGTKVTTTDFMACRDPSDVDFHKDYYENVIDIIPEDTEGEVLETLTDSSGVVVGHKVNFPGKGVCGIYYKGLISIEELNNNLAQAIIPPLPTKKPDAKPAPTLCKPIKNCNSTPLRKDHPRRHMFDKYIQQASLRWELPPEYIKASIMVETSFDDFVNRNERARYLRHLKNPNKVKLKPFLKNYKWGKGLGMFGTNTGLERGLAWYNDCQEIKELVPELKNMDVNKCHSDKVLRGKRHKHGAYLPGEEYKDAKGNVRTLKSVDDPQASIMAKAEHLNWFINYYSQRRKVGGHEIDFGHLLSDTEKMRMGIAAYNAGQANIDKAIREFIKKYGREPTSYAEIAPFLIKETGLRHNPCHVQKAMGLCGDPRSHMTEFAKDFSGDRNQSTQEAKGTQ